MQQIVITWKGVQRDSDSVLAHISTYSVVVMKQNYLFGQIRACTMFLMTQELSDSITVCLQPHCRDNEEDSAGRGY